METKSISALLSVDGPKAVVIVSCAIVFVYGGLKFVDKLYASSVVVNANGNSTEG